MSTDTECARHTDVMCVESVVKSLARLLVCTTESVRNAKHIPVQSRTGKSLRMRMKAAYELNSFMYAPDYSSQCYRG